MKNLSKLEKLGIDKENIKFPPKNILNKLENTDYTNNDRIDKEKIQLNNFLNNLNIYKNPQVIIKYLEDYSEGTERWKRIKLMVLGYGRAGKKIKNNNNNNNE